MKKVLLFVAAIIIIAVATVIYKMYIAPTRIALINYPEFLHAKVAKSNDNSFIKIDNLSPDSLSDLESYDMLIIFGMGIKMPAEEEQKVIAAGENGVNIYMQASTNPRLQLTNIVGKQLDDISGYLDNGGRKNYKNMLNYIRVNIDHKTFATDSIMPAEEIPSDVIFYTDEDAIFEKVKDFHEYCLKNNLHKEGQKNIVIFTSVPGPFNANREHINSLIEELQARNLNVYPIAGFSGRLNYMKEIKPSLIVYMPHGKLSMGGSPQRMQQWLKKQNVPVLCPLSVFQEYDKWLKDKMGMFGGLLSQSVSMPEFDGGVLPYAIFAQYKDENGLLLFKAIPNRLKKFGNIVENYLALTNKKNSEKKIAIVYFKGPGKNALEASGMEVLPSLHNTLLRLKAEGYKVDGLPTDFEQFKSKVMTEGPVLGPYAEGAFDKFLQSGKPELIDAETYVNWCKQTLPDELYSAVEKRYGKAPGSYMSVYKDSTDYIAVAAVKFGNVVLLPQPLPGIGENEYALVHGAKVAPPHTYIAPYLWIQNQFKADALFHFGTHGSLEFTPGKQIALSDYDWTDPLVGTIPHFYVYTISNVGEGMIAKRRSYAVTQTYLTPPFIEAQAFAQRNAMHKKIHKYEQATGALKTQYALSVKELAVKEGVNKDIGLDSILDTPYSPEDMMKLANYLEEIEHDKITGGLYTMGVKYTAEHLHESIRLMMIDALAYNLAEIDILNAKIDRNKLEDKMFFNNFYTHPCEKYVDEVLTNNNPDAMFKRLVDVKDYERANKWRNRDKATAKTHGKPKMEQEKAENEQSDTLVTDADRKKLRQLMIKILPNEKKKEFITKLKSKKEYERAIALLDPKKVARAQKIAKFIPAMKEALKIGSDPTVHSIIELIQKEELYKQALKYLSDNKLEQEVAAEKHRQDSILLNKSLSDSYLSQIAITDKMLNTMQLPQLIMLKDKLDFYTSNSKTLLELTAKTQSDKATKLSEFINNRLADMQHTAGNRIKKLEDIEETFANAVFTVQKTLNSILTKRNELAISPEAEFVSILNSLNGAYTAPSEGGDPIANPATIATGRNLVSISAESTPTKEAWKVAKKLGDQLIADFRKKHEGKYPEKISFTLWSSSFIESEGTTIAQILYMLGVEPVWDPFGRVKDIRLIPADELKRPRIDVLVQTSGQLRDLAASRLFLINRAIAKVAAEGGDKENNFVSKGAYDAEKRLIEKGFSPKQARKLSTKRIFGGVNGNYGTGIMGMVEQSDRWDSTQDVAKQYIENMGAIYDNQNNWGDFDAGVFEAALLNTQAVVQPRQSNTWGALSLDHVYEFMGGLNLAIKEVTGNDAESYFNDFRNTSNPRIQGLQEAIWVETRTTLLNPRYIKEYMKGGASSAETFAETFRNTFGWNVMKPSVIENRLWDELYKTYVEDDKNLGIHKFFEQKNPYALQEMTAVMLETIRKGMWKASDKQIKTIANLHAELVKDHEAGCSGFVCDNQKLKSFINKQLEPELQQEYNKQIDEVRNSESKQSKDNIVLKKEEETKKMKPATPSFTTDKLLLIVGIALIILILLIFVMKRRKK